jgi:hypothetical protein
MNIRPALYSVLLATAFINSTVGAAEIGAEIVFSDGEITAIRAYYDNAGSSAGSAGSMGMGMGMSGGLSALPPGIAKNLQRGKPLPPGIAKQVLPSALVNTLPREPEGYERIIVAGKILLVEIATQVIVDVITDVLFN